LFAVSYDLVDGVCVVCVYVALGLALDEYEGYAIDEQYDVGDDVLVALEVELVGDGVGVVLGVVVVDELDGLTVLVWSEGYGALVSEPVEELFVSLDVVVEACESVDDGLGVAFCLDCV